jgi:hypothetical protein
MKRHVHCSGQAQSLQTVVDGGNKADGQVVGDAGILVEFVLCHYMQVMM